MSGRFRSRLLAPAALAVGILATAAAPQDADIDIPGGHPFDQFITFELEGPPGRNYTLQLSPLLLQTCIPNVCYDIGPFSPWFDLSLSTFGVGTFDGNGESSKSLFPLPFAAFPELDVFPLYLQVLYTGATGSKLVGKSGVQILTLQVQNTWKPPFAGSDFSTERSVHTVTTLADGETLLITGGNVGGITGSFGQDTAELYSLADETLTVLPNTMVQARTGHTATLLDDGRVLLCGGADDVLGEPTDAAEVYDPVTQTFTAVGNMTGGPRALHRANKLADGRVILTGGTDNYIDPTSIILGMLSSTTIFDPVTNTFSPGPDMTAERLAHTATSLPNGDILLSGGYTLILGFIPVVSDTAELFDGTSFSGGLFLNVERMGHSATLLPDGKVLLVGGANGSDPFDPQPELSWDLWDPTLGFFQTGAINDGRILPGADALPDGRVVISGGATGSFLTPVSVQTAEIWDPNTLVSTPTGDLLTDRAGHMTVLLEDGTVLVTGGGQGTNPPPPAFPTQTGLTSLEIFQP